MKEPDLSAAHPAVLYCSGHELNGRSFPVFQLSINDAVSDPTVEQCSGRTARLHLSSLTDADLELAVAEAGRWPCRATFKLMDDV